ncbi:MAG: ribosome maturation factor RimM [Proteobacteria bacterium]|nr:ribosome maturation factor RimM [Pseudomonadota bacterium]
MTDNSDWIVIGRFGRAHGVKGLVTVHSFTHPRDNILGYTDWHAYISKQWQPINITSLEANTKSILARVEGYALREQVASLTNIEIAIKRSQLPELEPGEYYWHDLVGMQVVNLQGMILGNIIEMLGTGANDVMIIEGEKRRLVPYLPGTYVINIDKDRRLITVDWDMDF